MDVDGKLSQLLIAFEMDKGFEGLISKHFGGDPDPRDVTNAALQIWNFKKRKEGYEWQNLFGQLQNLLNTI